MAFLVGVQPLRAQQVRYIYDPLGRLIGVVDPQGRTAIYEYDAVGNILAIRRSDATGPVDITFVNPQLGVAGTRVEIFGIGFSDIASENQIDFNGVAAAVLAASSNSLSTEVPPGATTGPITVTSPLGSAVSPDVFTVLSNVTVTPGQAAFVVGGGLRFTATVTGTEDQRVLWSVNGVIGGFPVVGTITADGIYTAPDSVPDPNVVAIRATSVLSPDVFGESSVTIVDEANAFAHSAVSVRFGPPPPRGTLSPGVSVLFGPPPPGTTLSAPLSVTRGPVITSVSPESASPGSVVTLSVTGANLTGADELLFLRGGSDSALSASDLVVSPDGDGLTAVVTISSTASPGPRVLVVGTPTGSSTGFDTGVNVFTVE